MCPELQMLHKLRRTHADSSVVVVQDGEEDEDEGNDEEEESERKRKILNRSLMKKKSIYDKVSLHPYLYNTYLCNTLYCKYIHHPIILAVYITLCIIVSIYTTIYG